MITNLINENRKIVLYDGVCGLCIKSINFIRKRNSKKNLYFASLQSDYVKNNLENIDNNTLNLKTVIFIDGIKIFTKSHAILMILKNMDGLYPGFKKIFNLIPRSILDSFYNLIVINRYRIFKKQNKCNLPNSKESFLFLD